MKILALLLLFSATCLAQPSEPFKKANLILVTFDTLSVNSAFNAVGRTLIDAGYTINKSDRNFQTIETNVKNYAGNLSRFAISVIIRVSLKTITEERTEVKLSGVFGFNGDPTPGEEISFIGMKGSGYMVAFEKLQEIAKRISLLSESKITYAFQ